MSTTPQPGLDPRRLVRLMVAAIDRCQLDLAGRTVLTEAASGAYAVTPVIAALAGADVYALARTSGYATARDLVAGTKDLAKLAGVTARIEMVGEKSQEVVAAADIVTNSGLVRPIDAATIAQMKPSSVIPLMYESWEYRQSDVDLDACHDRGIAVAGTNEAHPAVDVFSYLGLMAVKQLHDAGVAVHGSRIVLLCDNSFGPFIGTSLRDAGADVSLGHQLTPTLLGPCPDAVILALTPGANVAFTVAEAKLLGEAAPGALLVQYWGDADRDAVAAAGVPVWPPEPPQPGHMGVLPSAIGPEPVVRLQAGGLKVGEVLARGLEDASPEELALVQVVSPGVSCLNV